MRDQSSPHYKNADQSASKLTVRHLATWALLTAALAVAVTGAYFWGASSARVTEIEILIPTAAPAVVQIVGEVRSPGVYELNIDDRVLDAIDAAGGMTDNAAIESINLAAIVKDGSRIIVPSIPPTPMSTSSSTTQNLPSRSVDREDTPATQSDEITPSQTPDYPIDLNSATLERLESLPGIGETRANQIIALRTALGGYSTLEQLLDISGIGTKTLEAIRPLVVIR